MNFTELSSSVRPEIIRATQAMGYTEMTEIQQKAIPLMLAGHDKIAKAPTGTGKTVISALDYKRFCKQHPGQPCRLLFVAHREELLKQSLYTHHQWTTRLMHSINVSYLSWFIARKLGCDEKAAARAGLLHDFCPYDFRAETPTGEHQAFYHPKAAADNSAAHFDVTDRELDAILSHMFPLGPLPRNREAWIISFADKACAIAEGCHIAIALARRNRIVIIPA